MKACPSCPNRHQADTLDALAQAVEGVRAFRFLAPAFRERAKAIREAGCQWWQILPVNEEPGFVEGCMAANLRLYLKRYGQDILLASDEVQKDRTEQAEALEAVEVAAREMGLTPVMEHLAQIGLRAAVGHKIEERRRAELAVGEERRIESGSPNPTPPPCVTEAATEESAA